MRSTLQVGLSVFLFGGVIALGCSAAEADAPNFKTEKSPPIHASTPSENALVVHEWGTFTSFSGSNGVKLEFRPLADVDLPKFVLNRQRQSGVLNPLIKVDARALQRMETPVTYFYADKPLQAKVRVDFPQGLLTEFFPPVEQLSPIVSLQETLWRQPDAFGGSSLDWGDVWILPEDNLKSSVNVENLKVQLDARIRQKLLPAAAVGDHYSFARETDSAMVYVEREFDEKLPLKPYGGFFEKFLFYRGIGRFDLPLKLTANSHGRFELHNLGASPIRQLFLVTVDDKQLRFRTYAQIEGGEKLSLEQAIEGSSVEALSEAVTSALIRERLYEKEARAMVKTWSDSWFGEQGTRLFYVLPTELTDELLPLSVQPKPTEVVRVMVGRMEILRPEDEQHIVKLVLQSSLDRTAAAKAQQADPKQAAPYPLPQEILALGRLAEPALVRVQNLTTDAGIAQEAAILLEEYNAYRQFNAKRQAIALGHADVQ